MKNLLLTSLRIFILVAISGCTKNFGGDMLIGASTVPAAASTFTVTGPAYGKMSLASTVFTVQPNGTLAQSLTVTPSDGAAGGTFTPASLNFAANTTSLPSAQTFTYTPAGLADYTISFAHSGTSGITNPSSMIYSTAKFVLMNDANVFRTPENWISNGAVSIETSNPGAYIKLGFTGTSIQLVIDASTDCPEPPKIGYSIDGGAVQYYTVATVNAALTIPLASGLSAGTHQARISLEGLGYADRWLSADANSGGGITNRDRLMSKKIILDGGAQSVAPSLKPKRLVTYGDSITEGANSLGNMNFVMYKQWSTTWGALLANDLNAEVSTIAFQGQGFEATGQGNVPAYLDAYASIKNGVPRTYSTPDYVVILHGANGTVTQADAALALTRMRAAYPSAEIYLGVPFGGYNRMVITDAFNAQADPKTYFFDLGGTGESTATANSTDGTHLTPTGYALLEAMMRAYIPHP
jgi:lysophospholipase L1-like esterase